MNTIKLYFLLLAGLFIAQMSVAQTTIVSAEYFINDDPGFGNATNIAISNSETEVQAVFTPDISSLNIGFHTLFVRSKDVNGKWGLPHATSIYKSTIETDSNEIDDIIAVEWFINNDPGFGNGNAIPITASDSVTIALSIEVPQDLPVGTHALSFRAKNSKGQWSIPFVEEFEKNELHQITSLQPTKGKRGDSFSLIGVHFASKSEDNLLTLGEHTVPVNQVNENRTEIFATVPDIPAGDYQVSLYIGGHTETINESFKVITPALQTDTYNLTLSALVGSQKDTTFYLHNTGLASMEISSIRFEDNRFQVTPSNAQLASGDSIPIKVSFYPSQRITYKDTLLIRSDAEIETRRIPVIGVGLDSDLHFSTLVTNFGKLMVGDSLTKSLWVHNRGNIAAELELLHEPASTFSYQLDKTTIEVLDSTRINLMFKPTQLGELMDSLKIKEIGKTQIRKISLFGEGMPSEVPFLVYDNGTVTFPVVGPGIEKSTTIWIYNRSALEAEITDLEGLSDPFYLLEISLPQTVPAGDSLDFVINLLATEAGSYLDTLLINYQNEKLTIQLSATIEQPRLSVSQLTYTFGEVAVGDSVESTLTISSVGNLEAEISAVTLSSEHYSLMPFEGNLADSVQIRFFFAPKTYGKFADSLKISANEEIITATLLGKSPEPTPIAVESELHFEEPMEGIPISKRLALVNRSINADDIVTITSSVESVAAELESGRTRIVRGDTTWIEVRFTPVANEALNDSLTITTKSGSKIKVGLQSPITTSNEHTAIVYEYKLDQNYPNPFNPATQINYALAKASKVRIEVYSIIGQKVAVLINQEQNAGNYTVNFDASMLSSGVYLYRLHAGDYIQVRKMILLK